MSACALIPVDTLACVASTKRLDPKYLAHLADVVKTVVERDFGGIQRGAAEKRLGISQSHISQLIRGEHGERGPGLPVLLKLREYTGMSLDALLGLPALTNEKLSDASLLQRVELLEQQAELQRLERPSQGPQRSTVRPSERGR